MSTVSKEDEEFFELIKNARKEFGDNPAFQGESWNWIHELDAEGFFIFSYLVEDYKQDTLSKADYEQTVYTLVMLRHKLLPAELGKRYGLTIRWQLQPLFNLYERMKVEPLTWEDCQQFVDQQIENLPVRREN